MLTNLRNAKKQGNVGIGFAIAWYTANEWTVCVPLNDSQDYDLIVEKDGDVRRIQVKTCRMKLPSGMYQVALKSMNKEQVKLFDANLVEDIFILTNDGCAYLIPSNVVSSRHSINVPGKYASFCITPRLTH